MKKHILKIREVDKINFDLIKSKEKKIETRANIDEYQKIEKGDFLIFTCGNEKIEKEVKSIKYFKSINQMVKEIDFKKITPLVNSIEEMKEIYCSFPNYKEKIKKFGIVAFYLK